MANIFSLNLKSRFPKCVEDTCKVETCELKLDGFPVTRVILNVDCIIESQDPGKRCDYVVVADENGETFFLPIEFKSGNSNIGKIKGQLECTIQFFKDYLPNQFTLYPVLVSKKLSTHERNSLFKTRISYGSVKKRIKHVQCNHSLKWNKVKNES